MYSIQLKIKRVSLADEARAIHREERILKGKRDFSTLESLHIHRINKVRPTARAAHLAHAILVGMPYAKVEHPKTRLSVPVESVVDNLRAFGTSELRLLDKKELFKFVDAWVEGGAGLVTKASNPQSTGSTPVAAS